MTKVKNNKLKDKLFDTRDQIFLNITSIQETASVFLENNKNNITSKNSDDLNVIISHCSSLSEKIQTSIPDELRLNFTKPAILEGFLSKIRHELHNSINIIMGYAELLITDLQKNNNTKNLNEIAKVIPMINNLIRLTNSIKLTTSNNYDLSNYLLMEGEDLDKDVDAPEYEDFKRGLSILIVDDVVENCNILERYLQQLGFLNITTTYDGLHALKLLKKNKYDLVLLDLDMPNISGKDILAYIKEDIIKQKLMVIIISGYDTMEDTVECIKLGAEDLISKPFNPDLLQVRINSCVEKKWYKFKENLYRIKYAYLKTNLVRGYYAINFLYLLWKL